MNDTNVVDIISKDESGNITLTISDHLDWSDVQEHLFILQEKLNTYLRFIESGEIYQKYPDARNKSLHIDVKFHYPLVAPGIDFLQTVKPIVEAAGVGFRFEMFSATPFKV